MLHHIHCKTAFFKYAPPRINAATEYATHQKVGKLNKRRGVFSNKYGPYTGLYHFHPILPFLFSRILFVTRCRQAWYHRELVWTIITHILFWWMMAQLRSMEEKLRYAPVSKTVSPTRRSLEVRIILYYVNSRFYFLVVDDLQSCLKPLLSI